MNKTKIIVGIAFTALLIQQNVFVVNAKPLEKSSVNVEYVDASGDTRRVTHYVPKDKVVLDRNHKPIKTTKSYKDIDALYTAVFGK